jgi:hypothetical protein
MTLDESKQILRAIGRKSPNLMEAVALYVENYQVGGGYGYNDTDGEFYVPDSAQDALENLAREFREMGNEPAAGERRSG